VGPVIFFQPTEFWRERNEKFIFDKKIISSNIALVRIPSILYNMVFILDGLYISNNAELGVSVYISFVFEKLTLVFGVTKYPRLYSDIFLSFFLRKLDDLVWLVVYLQQD
jgi:hypothetical protein